MAVFVPDIPNLMSTDEAYEVLIASNPERSKAWQERLAAIEKTGPLFDIEAVSLASWKAEPAVVADAAEAVLGGARRIRVGGARRARRSRPPSESGEGTPSAV